MDNILFFLENSSKNWLSADLKKIERDPSLENRFFKLMGKVKKTSGRLAETKFHKSYKMKNKISCRE